MIAPTISSSGMFEVTGVLWSSAAVTERYVRETVLTAVYRTAYILQNGPACTLRDRLAQEGYALAMAGCDSVPVATGDVFILETPGGGGYGSPP